MLRVPNSVDGHDSPELEIYGMDGIPREDLQRHQDGLPIIPYTRGKLIIGDSSILPILAAQKASVAAFLAESKNITVTGDSVGPPGLNLNGSIISSSSGTVSSSTSSSSSGVIVSLPVQANPVVPDANAAYWNNPYMMAAYYQQQQYQQYQHQPPQYQQPQYHHQPPQYQPPQQNQVYQQQAPPQQAAQYYQNYYQSQSYTNYHSAGNVDKSPEFKAPVTKLLLEEPQESQPLVIPPSLDPNTNKMIPGTIFTVLSLDRSIEELRSELKKYKNNNIK